ncbi:MAG TPA: Spy/CpxP family protein refolding chaperone [Leadbetterella sp.]|nr:Spy/CpxP family protein refolding chaperone [Leadbetterella sp.]
MKNIFLYISLIISTISFGQRPGGNPPGGERIRAMKVGMITNELKLTESQAEKFWPIYNNYSEEKNEIHQQIRRLTKRPDENLSNSEVIKRQDKILELQQDELDITKKYRDNFLRVITAQQYSNLMAAERKFNQMLLDKLKERRGID